MKNIIYIFRTPITNITISNDAGFLIRLKKSVFNVTSKAIQAMCINISKIIAGVLLMIFGKLQLIHFLDPDGESSFSKASVDGSVLYFYKKIMYYLVITS